MNDVIDLLPRFHFGHLPDEVIAKLLAGECVLVTGMPGFGRVYFPKFIKRILQNEQEGITIASVDTELLAKQSVRAISSQIQQQLGVSGNSSLLQFIRKLTKGQRLIITVEGVSPETSREVLHYFLTLVNEGKGSVSVLTVARCSMLRPPILNSIEGICLFKNVFILPPFDKKGTARMIEINNDRYGLAIHPGQYTDIHKITGGNPGLVLYLCIYLSEYGFTTCKNINHALTFPPLLARIKDIADIFYHESLQISEKVGIIHDDGSIFSDLIYTYLGNFQVPKQEGLSIRLSPREQRIFTILRENYNTLVEKEKIAKVLQIPTNTTLPWSAYKAVERLKAKLLPQYSILTVKGKGFILTDRQ